jgi:arginine decarboxylase
MSENATNEPHRLTASSVGLAIPKDDSKYGYLSEHHSFGETDQRAGDYSEDVAAEMLATVLGVEFDPNKSYDERKDTWSISTEIVKTYNITQSAIGDKNGLWTTVVAGAILIP